MQLRDYEVNVPEELIKLLPGFIARRVEDINKLYSLFQAENFEEISRIAHRLKGHGAGYGFEALSELGRRLEKSAKSRDGHSVSDLLSSYKNMVTEIDSQFSRGYFKK